MSLPPLVEPAPALSRDERERYARHLLIPTIGELGQRRLRAARVAVVGAGGLGSPALLYLAAAGIGHLSVIDDDVVDLTNLQRQVIHTTDAVGTPKVDSALAALAALNPGVTVEPRRVRLTASNADELLGGHDVVLDGADNFETRYVVADACARLRVPHVWGSIHRTQAQISVFWTAPPAPAVGVGLRDLFPHPPAPGSVPSCGDAGVLGALCGQAGSMMAGEVVKLVCGIGEPLLGRIAFVDVLTAEVTHVPLVPRRATAPAPAPPPPEAQAAIPTVSPRELAAALQSARPPVVVDVREPAELEFGAIAGSLRVPLQAFLDTPPAFDTEADVVVHCRLQPRAERAAAALRDAGHARVRVLEGGILAWGREVDPTVVPY